MYLDYLVIEPSLRMDDLELIDIFEGYIFFDQDFDDKLLKKMGKRVMEYDTIVRILHIMQL